MRTSFAVRDIAFFSSFQGRKKEASLRCVETAQKHPQRWKKKEEEGGRRFAGGGVLFSRTVRKRRGPSGILRQGKAVDAASGEEGRRSSGWEGHWPDLGKKEKKRGEQCQRRGP